MVTDCSRQGVRITGDDSYLRRDHCPCCGDGVQRSRLAVASNPPAEALPISDHGYFLSGYSANWIFFSYHRCDSCGLLYCPTYYTQSQLDRLYNRQAENMAEVSLDARRYTQAGYVRLVTRHSAMNGGFLELGADIGLFAEQCAQIGTFEKLWLYEPNLSVHDQLRSRVGKHDTTIRSENFSPDDLPARSVSTSALIHVLDHLLEPKARLDEIRRCLQPNGVILIVTHDCSSPLAKLLGRRWPPYTLQHPQIFSRHSLRQTLQHTGLDVLEVTSVRNFFPIMHLVRAGLAILGSSATLPDWPTPLLGLPLGNIAAVARNTARA